MPLHSTVNSHFALPSAELPSTPRTSDAQDPARPASCVDFRRTARGLARAGRWFRPGIELLEDRTLPSLMTLSEASNRLDGHVSGVTIVTHGFQASNGGGDSLLPVAEAIYQRITGAGQNAWFLNYTIPSEGGKAGFDPAGSAPGSGTSVLPGVISGQGELIILFDWAAESNEMSAGWARAAGDALFSMLVGLGVANPAAPDSSLDMHFIAHSFGFAVTSEAVRSSCGFTNRRRPGHLSRSPRLRSNVASRGRGPGGAWLGHAGRLRGRRLGQRRL